MQVLLVAATPFEIAPTISWLENTFGTDGNGRFINGALDVQVGISGVGMLNTCWKMAGFLALKRPDFAINAGVAGAIDRSLQLGDVRLVATERLADLGVEDAEGQFTDLFELGFEDRDRAPFSGGKMINPGKAAYLPAVNGITVNKAHGSEASIAALREKYPDAQLESMEGAAFFYACLKTGVPFAEIRSISNYVEPRNRETWDLPLAISNLNEVIRQVLTAMTE